MKLRFPEALVATESEYRANHTGMNTFFGAVLGFVMAGTERLDTEEFALVLSIVSGIVIPYFTYRPVPKSWSMRC